MDPSELRSRVDDLNSICAFQNPLNYDKLAEVAAHVGAAKIEQVLKEVEDKKDTVKDPTAWVTSALRKASSGKTGGQSRGGGGGVDAEDGKLRKRIGWLNGDGGGFGGAIIYDKVLAAAGGLPYSDVMRVLKELEEKKDDVKDPNAWVCSALRKAGGGNPQAPPAFAWAPPPAAAWGPPTGSPAWGALPSGGFDAGADSKVRKRVQWLNTTGGFGNAIDAQKVSEAAAGISDVKDIMKVLKDVEENRDKVKDPNAYVCAALRKLGGGARGGGGGSDWGAPAMHAMGGGNWGAPPMQAAWSGPPAAASWAPADIQGEDAKLRKRIGWLNSQGGFAGAIIYDKIMEAAGGIEFAEVFRQLQQLEEKRDTIKDATAWICKGLRRVASQGGAQGPAMQYGGDWAPPPSQWSGGGNIYGGASPMDVDGSNSKLRKRVQWLNDNEGFANPLDFQKVSEAAVGLDSTMQMKVLKDLQEKKDTVRDPTSYVTAAYRKVGGGSKGGGKGAPMGNGVRRTIAKNRH